MIKELITCLSLKPFIEVQKEVIKASEETLRLVTKNGVALDVLKKERR